MSLSTLQYLPLNIHPKDSNTTSETWKYVSGRGPYVYPKLNVDLGDMNGYHLDGKTFTKTYDGDFDYNAGSDRSISSDSKGKCIDMWRYDKYASSSNADREQALYLYGAWGSSYVDTSAKKFKTNAPTMGIRNAIGVTFKFSDSGSHDGDTSGRIKNMNGVYARMDDNSRSVKIVSYSEKIGGASYNTSHKDSSSDSHTMTYQLPDSRIAWVHSEKWILMGYMWEINHYINCCGSKTSSAKIWNLRPIIRAKNESLYNAGSYTASRGQVIYKQATLNDFRESTSSLVKVATT